MEKSSEPAGAIAIAVGPAVALIAAGLMSGFRDDIGQANVAVTLAGVVVVVALAGRWAGVATALVAALAYNYFHTLPYHSLRIGAFRDVVTVLLLLAIGLIVSETSAWRRRSNAAAKRRLQMTQSLESVAASLADGASPDEIWTIVERQLSQGLDLTHCTYEPGAVPRLPTLPRTGSLVGPAMRVGRGGFVLPKAGVSIAVAYRARVLGHIVMIPDEEHGSSIDDRRLAVALADQFAVSLAVVASASRFEGRV